MEGTKPYRKKIPPQSTLPPPEEHAPKPAPIADLERDAANLNRRAWFGSLVPALGDGLVKLLRASNNLKDDLREIHEGDSRSDA